MGTFFEQVYVLGMMGIVGWFGGLLFDIFRIMAQLRGLGRRGLVVFDLIYSLSFTGVFLVCILALNHGQLRSYVYLGVLVGFFIYFKWFHGLLWGFMWGLVSLVGRILGKIWRLLTWPFRLVVYLFSLVGRGIKKCLKKPPEPDEIQQNQGQDEN